jgi:Ca-activated chloride channel homolog
MEATVKLDHSLLAVDTEHDVHVMLELTAPETDAAEERAPLNLALVLDRSGSMHGEKLETAKQCAAWLVERLRAGDRLALVAYDDEVTLVSGLAPVVSDQLVAALAHVPPGGQTNLSGGWLKGLEELRRAPAGEPRTILLLTDGLANVGITDPGRLTGLAGGARRDGIGTTTIGFGAGFDEELLTAMADAGGGNGHFAETPDAAPAIFAEELEGLTQLVAQNVSVEIRPAAPVEFVAVLNEYPAVAVDGGVRLGLGDAYAGDRRRLVLNFHVPHLAAYGPAAVAELVVRYVSVGDEVAEHTLTVPVVANLVSADEAAAAAPDAQVREEVLVLQAAKARRQAIDFADRGDIHAARATLAAAAGNLRAADLVAPAQELDEAMEQVENYTRASRKQLWYQAQQVRRKRNR